MGQLMECNAEARTGAEAEMAETPDTEWHGHRKGGFKKRFIVKDL